MTSTETPMQSQALPAAPSPARWKFMTPYPKGPCAQVVYTLALNYSLYGYVGPKVCAIWVHGPVGYGDQNIPKALYSMFFGPKRLNR